MLPGCEFASPEGRLWSFGRSCPPYQEMLKSERDKFARKLLKSRPPRHEFAAPRLSCRMTRYGQQFISSSPNRRFDPSCFRSGD